MHLQDCKTDKTPAGQQTRQEKYLAKLGCKKDFYSIVQQPAMKQKTWKNHSVCSYKRKEWCEHIGPNQLESNESSIMLAICYQ
jgi:hypothetical protein